MKKIIVIGCPGSGKSTLARALHERTGIPLYHLDLMYWNEDRTTVERDEFLRRLSFVISGAEWIIDGNYSSTMEMRIEACDTVIFLDYPLDVCLDGVRARRGVKRTDMPWIEAEEDAEFIEFIKNYRVQHRPAVLQLIQKYKDKNTVILKSREDGDTFLNSFDL